MPVTTEPKWPCCLSDTKIGLDEDRCISLDGSLWMENEPKVLNKGYLVGKLRERGLSRRAAVRILDAVLDEVAAALSRGEVVEFPLGCLKRVRHAYGEQPGQPLGKITTIYKMPI